MPVINYFSYDRKAPNRIMATKRVVLETSIKLLAPSIITILVLWLLSVNSITQIAKSDIPHEIDYYNSLSGVYMDSTHQ